MRIKFSHSKFVQWHKFAGYSKNGGLKYHVRRTEGISIYKREMYRL